MDTKQLIVAAVVVAASAPVFADALEYPVPDANFVSTKSRAEVVMELRQAQNEGWTAFSEYSYPEIQQASTPAQTRNIEMAGSDSYFFEFPQDLVPGRSRAEARTEAIESNRNRTLDPSDTYFGG